MKMTRQNAARLNPMNPDSVVVLERSCFSDSRAVMLRESARRRSNLIAARKLLLIRFWQ